MSGILQKFIGLQVFEDSSRVSKLLGLLEVMPESERELHYGGSALVGNCFIKDSPGLQQCVLEVVFAGDGKDSLATLYKSHPLFQSIVSYREGRSELVNCIADLANTTPDNLALQCPMRNRNVGVRDLGVHQLIELIQSAVDTWTTDTSKTPH